MMFRWCFPGMALLFTILPCAAQSSVFLMPEGSKEIVYGVATFYGPRDSGSKVKQFGARPVIYAEWSNGVFIDMNTIGIELSDQPDLRYGVVWTLLNRNVGGFVRYGITRGLAVSSRLSIGESPNHRGMSARTGLSYWTWPLPHHAVGMDLDVSLANRASLQSEFGDIAKWPAYQARSGMRDATLSLRWNWELTNKTTVRTWVQEQRFLSGVRSSPRLERPSGTTLGTMILWRY